MMDRQLVMVLAALVFAGGCMPNPAATRPEWRRLARTPAELGLAADTVSFVTVDSLRLRAWWLPATTPPARATVVLAHGSGTNRAGMLPRAAFIVAAGYDALAVDLRAHGESEGEYMSPGWREADDIRAAVAWLRARDAALPIVVLGHSYGAVAALHAGRDSALAAVIADAPFKSYDAMIRNASAAAKNDPRVTRGQRFGMAMVRVPGIRHLMAWHLSRSAGRVPADSAPASFAVTQLRVPALFIAGERDAIAIAPDVRQLHDSAAAPVRVYVELVGATHRTHGDAREQYEREVLAFIQAVLSAAPQR